MDGEEAEDGEAEDEEPKIKKHSSGTDDMEKVTDFFEEKETGASVGTKLEEVHLLSLRCTSNKHLLSRKACPVFGNLHVVNFIPGIFAMTRQAFKAETERQKHEQEEAAKR